ncbi:bifunctional metallophosphatase/5'-nucleotidase [Lutimonas zeaxanthinifaciens]|uniref:bifunctional metallophosphatase/5'-nucleotidase n=1 Tax=Lutimonas zeaxanthinifaciens TaxID=3060215 RepID=UPI00265D573D|nr:metallophosphatase [Lutimonas sp. YSD2104]WKK64879.1 metallophosphatase [Lutimonas sp. YSD2104]
MERRKFIKNSLAAGSLVGLGSLPLNSCETSGEKKITILHTNDVHSHIEPFAANHSRYPNIGGVSRRATLIQKLKKENPNTLLFDAGDIFQGTPYFNYFGGEVEFKMMSKLGYDAATIGNHDFDNSIEGLEKQLPHARFDFLISNYNFSNTVMDGRTLPYKVYQRDGLKIGVFGIGIKLEGLVDPRLFKETVYLDPVEISQDMTKILKEEQNCDLVICLSHLGYYYKKYPESMSDLTLAKRTGNIDLIIGGHSHTFLKKPTVVKNIDGENMLVNQVGCWGVNMGKIDFIFDDQKAVSSKGTSIIV